MSQAPYGFELTRHDYFTRETDYKMKKRKKENKCIHLQGTVLNIIPLLKQPEN
jgi:hypothetical protein